MIYMDYAATTPPRKDVLNAMHAVASSHFGNPSSLHDLGIKAKKRYNQAKKNMASMLGVSAKQIIFTSGGTEAVNTALKGSYFKAPKKTIVTTQIEHAAGIKTAKFIADNGGDIAYVNVDNKGYVDLTHLKSLLDNKDVSLISIIYANNEIGTMQNIEALGQLKKDYGVKLHLDMVQAPAHEAIDLSRYDIDFASFSAHKFYGPRGIGLLYAKEPDTIENLLHGGNHEYGKRASTENLAAIVGMEKAFECLKEKPEDKNHIQNLAAYFLKRLEEEKIDFKLNGPSLDEPRLCSTLNLGFKNEDAQMMAFKLNEAGIFISIGSACHSQVIEPSHVLKSIRVPDAYLYGSMRFSFSEQETTQDIDKIVKTIKDLIVSDETKK